MTACPRIRAGEVDATGTRRRLEAMLALGHPATAIGAHPALQLAPATARTLVSRWRRLATIKARTAAAVTEVYRDLAGRPGSNTTVRIYALKSGCLPPDAWTGLDMDDPATTPHDGTNGAAA